MARAPIHREIKRLLLDEIDRGVFPPGARLTPEVELARRFGVSRPTVRQAVLELARAGVVSRRPGVGTIVQAPRLEYPVGKLMSFSQEFAASGNRPSATVVECAVVRADEALADRLEVNVGERVFRLERIRRVDGGPVAWQRSQIPHRLVEGIESIDFADRSLYAVLHDQYRLEIDRADETVRAGAADSVDGERLGVRPDSPVFRVERRGFTAAGLFVELVDSVYRSDRYEIRLALRT
jgi:GntR family transcriptional regulator